MINVNDPPTGTVTITGTVQEDQTLTANTTGLGDADGLGAFTYQWQYSTDGNVWTNITGATNTTFVPGDAQVGQKLRVQVSYTDGHGTPETVLGTPSIAVANVNDAPSFTGDAALAPVLEDATTNNGATIASLFSSKFNDPDSGSNLGD